MGIKLKMKGKGVDPDQLEEWLGISGIKGPPLPVQEEPQAEDAEKVVILTDGSPTVLGDGFVVIKKALDEKEQRWLAQYAFGAGKRKAPLGWWKDADYTELNVSPSRGRIYEAIERYPGPERIRALCLKLVSRCRAVQPKLPEMDVTHMLLLLYTSAQGMVWHRDSDKNDGDNDHPIVSISLGNASDFGYKPLFRGEQVIRLESGDVAVWGGPQRMLEHAVLKVHSDTCPPHLRDLIGDGRINFTFRSARNILGKEAEFSTATFATFT